MKKKITSSPKIGNDVVYLTLLNCSPRTVAIKMKVWREMADNYGASKNKEVTFASK